MIKCLGRPTKKYREPDDDVKAHALIGRPPHIGHEKFSEVVGQAGTLVPGKI